MATPAECAAAQLAYCQAQGLQDYAPCGPNRVGVCFHCNEQIFESPSIKIRPWASKKTAGITLAEASSTHITQCPHCHRPFGPF